MMDVVIYQNVIFGIPLVLTPWKIFGYVGIALFGGRWLVQLVASKLRGRPTLPRLFWYMSITGSLMLLCYFSFGRRDSVGIISNLFPMLVASYNLWLDMRHARRRQQAPEVAE